MTTKPDFRFACHGSVTILTPLTEPAREWVSEHIPADATLWGSGVVIEPRYAGPIIDAILGAGLEVAS